MKLDDIATFIKRSCEQSGFERIRYDDDKVPTSFSNVSIILLYGNVRSQFIVSSLLLKPYIESRPSRYFVVCSWPDSDILFHYADEFWSCPDAEILKLMSRHARTLDNGSDTCLSLERTLHRYFEEVITYDTLKKYYDSGFTKEFFTKFKNIEYHLPFIPTLPLDLSKKFAKIGGTKKVFIYPTRNVQSWNKKEVNVTSSENFWLRLVETLLDVGYTPVIYHNYATYDLSTKFDASTCIHIDNKPISSVLSAMRNSDCVVDIFSGISRYALIARCPFVAMDERRRYEATREYEIDDLCAQQIPREYIFANTGLVGEAPSRIVYEGVVNKLDKMIEDLDRNHLPPTGETTQILSYNQLRNRRTRKLGTKLFKVERI